MCKTFGTALLVSLLIFALAIPAPMQKTTNAAQTPGAIRIYGSVNRPLNFTYGELLTLPMVSEVARLICEGGSPEVTYNWTGIPLFHLLTLAEIKPEAYKMVTRASDGYTSELLIEEALRPTTILALRANGGELPRLTFGPAGPYRLIVPGKWGLKWVSGIESFQILPVIDPEHYDQADVPNYGPMPTPTPPLQTLDLSYGNRTIEVETFTNASIRAYSLNILQKALAFNVTVPKGKSAFMDLILKQESLSRPYKVTSDGKPTSTIEGDTNTTSYIYLTFEEGFHSARALYDYGSVPEFPSLDNTPPAISIASPENKVYHTSDISLTFILNEPASWIGYSLSGRDNVTIGGNTTILGLSGGSHSLMVYAKDTAGNTGVSEMIYFTIETQQTEPLPFEPFQIGIVAAVVILTALVVALYLLGVRKSY